MGSHAITPGWALHETANGMLAVAKGVLTAATSDNVQPLALLAAEAFGNTLAICEQTQLLVEKEARKQHTSYIVKFLKAKIGYSAHDSAIQLSSSNAGIRFLSLAAALLCTSSNFTGAQALDLMIKETAKKDQLLPTILQLQDLLGALDYKLLRTRFADDIVGWETFLFEHPNCPPPVRQGIRHTPLHPPVDELEKLVDAFRTIGRVGEDDNATIQITSAITSPWIVAFTKWCLGIPPKILTEDGAIILSQPNSKITMFVAPKILITARIEVVRDLKGPTELWAGNDNAYTAARWSGMVSIQQYGARRLREVTFLNESGYRALSQALSYTPNLVKTTFRILKPELVAESLEGLDLSSQAARQTGPTPSTTSYSQCFADLWPSERKISSILTEFMNLETPINHLAVLKESETIVDLPLVKTYIKDIRESCRCSTCSKDMSRLDRCLLETFKDSVVDITRDVLALSLFNTIEPILVLLSATRSHSTSRSFQDAIRSIIFGSVNKGCHMSAIFDTALYLIGHKTSDDINTNESADGKRTWIASSYRGQVVYPSFFDIMNLENQSLLSLGGGPGALEYKAMKCDMVVWGELGLHPRVKVWSEVPVTGPQNLLRDEQLAWQVKVGNRCLELSCGLANSVMKFNPMAMLKTAATSLFVCNCSHDKEQSLSKPDIHCYYITPCFDKMSIENNFNENPDLVELNTGIVAVAGNDGLRSFALIGGTPAVIRGSACLQCCIDICRRVGFYYIIV